MSFYVWSAPLVAADVAVTGTVAVTQADQTSTASGTVLNPITGSVAVTQADQTSTASGAESFSGTAAVTQDAQTSTASGSVANPVTGTVAVIQADQASTASGLETITGTSANSQADQTSTTSGSVANPVTGTVAVTQADQTSGASGTVGSFPVVASLTSTVFGTAATSHLVAMPATVDAGDLLIVAFASSTDAVTAPGSFTQLHSTINAAPRLGNYYRIADGTEDGATFDFTTPGARKAVAHVYRITGWHGTTPPEIGTASTGNSTNPDPPSLTPSWGSADGLWLVTTAINGASTVSAYPTSYTDGADDNTTGAGSVGLGTARRNLTAVSDDPATFTISGSVTWVAQTIGIRPVAVLAPISGTVAVSQDPQTSTATGVESFTGTSTATQADQTSTGTAVETYTGTSANIQADQSSAIVGVLGFSGTATATQADQTSVANGTALVAVTGTVAVTQADQFTTTSGVAGVVIFWSPNPVGYTVNPVSHVKAPVAFVKVGAGDDPPW